MAGRCGPPVGRLRWSGCVPRHALPKGKSEKIFNLANPFANPVPPGCGGPKPLASGKHDGAGVSVGRGLGNRPRPKTYRHAWPLRYERKEVSWCRGPDSNRQAVKRRIFVTLRLSTPSASTRKANVRALDYAFAIAMRVLHAHRLRRPPSSLYTFRAFRPASAGKKTGLARRCLVARVWIACTQGFRRI